MNEIFHDVKIGEPHHADPRGFRVGPLYPVEVEMTNFHRYCAEKYLFIVLVYT